MRRTAIGLLVAAAVLLPASPCLACSCVPVTAAEAFDRAEVVFTGLAAEDTTASFSAGDVEVRFVIEEVHKGRPLGPTASVFGSNQGSACGIHFRQGTRYTVYAFEDSGGLETNSCSGTHLGELGQGVDVPMHPAGALPAGSYAPAAADSPLRDRGSDDAPLVVGLVAMALAATAAAIVLRRRAG